MTLLKITSGYDTKIIETPFYKSSMEYHTPNEVKTLIELSELLENFDVTVMVTRATMEVLKQEYYL